MNRVLEILIVLFVAAIVAITCMSCEVDKMTAQTDALLADTRGSQAQPTEPQIVSIGVFKVTAYCPKSCCCGDSADGLTATMTTATPGRTLSVDPDVIPYGTHVTIGGHEYIAEDCGGGIKNNHVEILFASHQEALNFGVRYLEVFYGC